MPDTNWANVATHVRARRLGLGLTQKEAADLGGISEPTWGLIENAKQDSYKARVLSGVCRAMQWTSGSINLMLRGAEPVTLDGVPGVSAQELTVLLREAAQRIEQAAEKGA